MSTPFDLENYMEPDEIRRDGKVPNRWRGEHEYMYLALQQLAECRRQRIKEAPRAYRDRNYIVTTKDLCDALGKDKSYLHKSRWSSKNTPIRRAMALLVTELDELNEQLKAKLELQRLKKSVVRQTRSQKKKSALVAENCRLQKNYNNLLKQGYEELIQQINFSGDELAAKCEDLAVALEKEREKNANLIYERRQQVKTQTHSIAEIERLTRLNASLENELAELRDLVGR